MFCRGYGGGHYFNPYLGYSGRRKRNVESSTEGVTHSQPDIPEYVHNRVAHPLLQATIEKIKEKEAKRKQSGKIVFEENDYEGRKMKSRRRRAAQEAKDIASSGILRIKDTPNEQLESQRQVEQTNKNTHNHFTRDHRLNSPVSNIDPSVYRPLSTFYSYPSTSNFNQDVQARTPQKNYIIIREQSHGSTPAATPDKNYLSSREPATAYPDTNTRTASISSVRHQPLYPDINKPEMSYYVKRPMEEKKETNKALPQAARVVLEEETNVVNCRKESEARSIHRFSHQMLQSALAEDRDACGLSLMCVIGRTPIHMLPPKAIGLRELIRCTLLNADMSMLKCSCFQISYEIY